MHAGELDIPVCQEHCVMAIHKDQDREKGAVEQDEPGQAGNTSLPGQLGHRDQDPILKEADSDFPEPGQSPEHSGEPETVENKRRLDEVA